VTAGIGDAGPAGRPSRARPREPDGGPGRGVTTLPVRVSDMGSAVADEYSAATREMARLPPTTPETQ
jgi:hypothetical protein